MRHFFVLFWLLATSWAQAQVVPDFVSQALGEEPQPLVVPTIYQPVREAVEVEVRGPVTGRALFQLSGAQGYSAQARADRIYSRLEKFVESQGEVAPLVGINRVGET